VKGLQTYITRIIVESLIHCREPAQRKSASDSSPTVTHMYNTFVTLPRFVAGANESKCRVSNPVFGCWRAGVSRTAPLKRFGLTRAQSRPHVTSHPVTAHRTPAEALQDRRLQYRAIFFDSIRTALAAAALQ